MKKSILIALLVAMLFFAIGNLSVLNARASALCSLPFSSALSASSVPSTEISYLTLVNKSAPLSAGYVPPNLCKYNGIALHPIARDAFVKMLSDIESEKIYGLKLQSAYRSYSYQSAVFNQRVKEVMAKGHTKYEAKIIAAKSVQPAGASEHQLGLALDVSIDGTLTPNFGETLAGKWLAENCHKYGFIIRYPESKTEITKIMYEPWHLRYVGEPHASIIKELNMTLEEYWEFIKSIYAYVYWLPDGGYYKIFYQGSDIITLLKP